MRNKGRGSFLFLAAVFSAGVSVGLRGANGAGGPVPLPGSIVPVPPTGASPSAGPSIARTTLLPSESAAPMDIEVALHMRNFAGLLSRLAAGERIGAAEMVAMYDPLEADYSNVDAWITGQGLTVTLRDPSRLVLFARGPVGQVMKAFNVSMARVSADGAEYTSATSSPSVPSDLAPAILGVNGLQPHVMARKHSVFVPLQADSRTGNGPPFLPGQIAHAYQAEMVSETGSGQKIAIVIDTFPLTTDLVSFWTVCNVGQSLGNMEFIQAVSGTLPAPSGEETLDVEWSSSIASAAKVRVYATTDLSFVHIDQAYTRILSD